jgi:hypothetical protein
MTIKDRSNATYLLALSYFCLSGAIVYFGVELTRMTRQLPELIRSVDAAQQKIPPVIEEIRQTRNEVPTILDEVGKVREQIPFILEEVRQVRALIPSILDEVARVREQIPPTLSEVKHVRQMVPPILKEVKGLQQQVPAVLEEARSTRTLASRAINEVVTTREALPPLLDQAERIVDNMYEIGQNTGEGAVTGIFRGILKTPFNIVGNIGRSIFSLGSKDVQGLTPMDETLIVQRINELALKNQLGKTLGWANPRSGNEGAVTLNKRTSINEQECLVLDFVIRLEQSESASEDVTLCLNADSEWEVVE